jgi:arylsulfatase
VKDKVGQEAQTFIEFPPVQKGASFNLEALKQDLEKKLASRGAQ